MNITLTCGCKAENLDSGIFCNWEEEKNDKKSVFYGILCSEHYIEYKAIPADEKMTVNELADEQIKPTFEELEACVPIETMEFDEDGFQFTKGQWIKFLSNVRMLVLNKTKRREQEK
jgi:hypothetical protein